MKSTGRCISGFFFFSSPSMLIATRWVQLSMRYLLLVIWRIMLNHGRGERFGLADSRISEKLKYLRIDGTNAINWACFFRVIIDVI